MSDKFKLHNVGLMQHEMEEILSALRLSAHICQNFEQNTARHERIKSMANRFYTLLVDIEG